MKIIKLGNKKEEIYTIVDDVDYEVLKNYSWNFNGGYVVHSLTNGEDRGKKIRMHRLILNAKNNEIVDHINGNALDNRRSNLRITDIRGNTRNATKMTRTKPITSKYKGVSWDKNMSAWKVAIKNGNKVEHLGYFNSEDAAGLMYNIKAKEVFGEFAWLNEIDSNIDNPETHRIKRTKSSQYFGVTWNKGKKKWSAQIYLDKKVNHLGEFDDEKEAATRVNYFIVKNKLNKPLNKIK